MGDLSREDQLLFETLQCFRIVRQFRPYHLDRHTPVQFNVPGLVDRAHATLAQDLKKLVASSEQSSGGQVLRASPGIGRHARPCRGSAHAG